MKSSHERRSSTQESSFTVVCLAGMFWDEHWSSQQQLMSRLSKRCPVLYVERPVSFLSFFTGVSDASVGRQIWRWLKGGIRYENPSLAILSPPPCLPLRFHRLANKLNEWVRVRALKRAIRKLQIQNFVLWVYEPDAALSVKALAPKLSLYYCADDWAALGQWWNKAGDIRAREEELGAAVDMVVGTSTKIANRWKAIHDNALLVYNGADVASFSKARDPELTVPDDLLRIPEPRIGYVGFVDGRFDTELYWLVASGHPEWQFVVVGPLMEKMVDVSRLKQLPNVHFLGPRERPELPRYLKGFQVCTIPYIRNQLSESIFPLKFFEYLAAGKTMVATALPELQSFTDYVRWAPAAEEFAAAIQASLDSPFPQASGDYLASHSWDAKAELLWNLISDAVRAPGEEGKRRPQADRPSLPAQEILASAGKG